MVKLILGDKGTGKTKQIIDLVNNAVTSDKGSVVCLAKGDKLKFDIASSARLVDMSDYCVSDYSSLIGFIAGLHAGNYDISQIFIDSLYKLVNNDNLEDAGKFLTALENFSGAHSVTFTVAVSTSEEDATEAMKKYI